QIVYDTATRTAVLNFDALGPDTYEIRVGGRLTSAAGIPLEGVFQSSFTALSNLAGLT
ncbi:MAG: hypothetical protein GTO03_03560, partial [Planctomycetales bacterium]|nr:hypothetical protein [Planctomycetales bacterium]